MGNKCCFDLNLSTADSHMFWSERSWFSYFAPRNYTDLVLCPNSPANTFTYMPDTPPCHPLTYTHSYVNTQRQAVPLWVSAAEHELLNNWQWWVARSQSETNLKRSARDVNSTHINYHWLLACLHHSTDWQLDTTLTIVGYGDFGFRFAVITMSNTCSHMCQVATQL